MDLLRTSKNNFQLLTTTGKYLKSQIRYKQILTTDEKNNNNQHQTSNNKVSKEIIEKLERLSLVGFENDAGIKRLEAAIKFTEKLKYFNVDDKVLPLYSVLENVNLRLRNDEITDGNYRKKILKNASLSEEDYFVAPPGNIPFEK